MAAPAKRVSGRRGAERSERSAGNAQKLIPLMILNRHLGHHDTREGGGDLQRLRGARVTEHRPCASASSNRRPGGRGPAEHGALVPGAPRLGPERPNRRISKMDRGQLHRTGADVTELRLRIIQSPTSISPGSPSKQPTQSLDHRNIRGNAMTGITRVKQYGLSSPTARRTPHKERFLLPSIAMTFE